MNTITEKQDKQTTPDTRAILAVMPVLPTSADLRERLETLHAEASAALSYAFEQMESVIAGDENLSESSAEIQKALVYADDQMRGLQALTEEAHAALATVSAYAQTVTEQRDKLVSAYKRAFEHGILHAYECEACMEDAEVESLAERMIDSSPDEVAIDEAETLNAKLEMAVELYDGWVSEEIAGITDPDAYDRTDLLGLVEESGGIDLDEVDYDVAQIEEDRVLIASLEQMGSDDDDFDEDDEWIGDDEDDDDFDE